MGAWASHTSQQWPLSPPDDGEGQGLVVRAGEQRGFVAVGLGGHPAPLNDVPIATARRQVRPDFIENAHGPIA